MAKAYKLKIKSGQTFPLQIIWNEATPLLLTDSIVQMDFREYHGGPILASVRSIWGEIMVEPSERSITIYIPAEKTAMLGGDTVKRGVFDVKVVLSNGFIDYPIDGTYRCYPRVTV